MLVLGFRGSSDAQGIFMPVLDEAFNQEFWNLSQ